MSRMGRQGHHQVCAGLPEIQTVTTVQAEWVYWCYTVMTPEAAGTQQHRMLQPWVE